MDYLSKKNETIFIGQAVEYAGTAMSNTLKDVSPIKKIDSPKNLIAINVLSKILKAAKTG